MYMGMIVCVHGHDCVCTCQWVCFRVCIKVAHLRGYGSVRVYGMLVYGTYAGYALARSLGPSIQSSGLNLVRVFVVAALANE